MLYVLADGFVVQNWQEMLADRPSAVNYVIGRKCLDMFVVNYVYLRSTQEILQSNRIVLFGISPVLVDNRL